jgi:hypothetical protein
MRVSKGKATSFYTVKDRTDLSERDTPFLYEDADGTPVIILYVGGAFHGLSLTTRSLQVTFPLVRQLQGYSVTLTNE